MTFTREQRELVSSSRLDLSDPKMGGGHQSIPRLQRSAAMHLFLTSVALWAQGF